MCAAVTPYTQFLSGWYQYVGRTIVRSCEAQAMYIKLYARCYQARVMWVEL